jgi:hypothetical protein
MNDARNYMTAKTGDAFAASAVGSKPGVGTQKFINVWGDGGFATGVEVASMHLISKDTTPGAGDEVLGLFIDRTAAELSTAGLIAKVPLPSKGLLDLINVYFYAETTLTAGGKISVFITLD